jgi:EamA domain-containing membrane protein RarD
MHAAWSRASRWLPAAVLLALALLPAVLSPYLMDLTVKILISAIFALSLQLLVGLTYFHEHFDPHKLVGFTCIWCGLILYSADAVLALRHTQPQ